MSDSLFQRLQMLKTTSMIPKAPSTDEDHAEIDDFGAFHFLRGTRERAWMLQFRKVDGTIRAYGYSWLNHAEFEPSGTIVLTFVNEKVRIKGRNLNAEIRPSVRLFEGIVRQRVSLIQEADEHALIETEVHLPIVERIEF